MGGSGATTLRGQQCFASAAGSGLQTTLLGKGPCADRMSEVVRPPSRTRAGGVGRGWGWGCARGSGRERVFVRRARGPDVVPPRRRVRRMGVGRAPDELDGRQVSRREGVRSPYTLQAGYPIRHPRSWGRSAWSRTCECAVCECICEGRVLHAPTPQTPSPAPRGRTPSRHRTPSHLHKGHPSGREKPARDAFVARMVSWTFHPPHRVLFRFRTAYFGSLSVQGYPILNPKGKVRVHRPLSTCNRKQNLLTGHHPPGVHIWVAGHHRPRQKG